MDLKKEKEIAEEMAAKENEVAQAVAEAPKQEDESWKAVKLRTVLTDYFYKRKDRIGKDLLDKLKQTQVREAVTVDSYGAYKPGVFTYGAFWVFVDFDEESRLWQLNIIPGEKGGAVGEYVIEKVRDRFVPDDAWMVKMYPPRKDRQDLDGVILYQMPSGEVGEE